MMLLDVIFRRKFLVKRFSDLLDQEKYDQAARILAWFGTIDLGGIICTLQKGPGGKKEILWESKLSDLWGIYGK